MKPLQSPVCFPSPFINPLKLKLIEMIGAWNEPEPSTFFDDSTGQSVHFNSNLGPVEASQTSQQSSIDPAQHAFDLLQTTGNFSSDCEMRKN